MNFVAFRNGFEVCRIKVFKSQTQKSPFSEIVNSFSEVLLKDAEIGISPS
jgi:hypothetical protein